MLERSGLPLLGKIALDQVGPLSPRPARPYRPQPPHPLPPAQPSRRLAHRPPPAARSARPVFCSNLRLRPQPSSSAPRAPLPLSSSATRPLQTLFSLYINAAFCVLTEALQRRPLRAALAKARPRTP